MRWWRSKAVCVCTVVLIALSAASARGESILRLDHKPKPKAAAKEKTKSFSLLAMPARDDSDFDRYAHFLLAGKKEQPPTHLVSINKKKVPEPPIQEGGKHSKKVQLKVLKVTPKPAHSEPLPDLSVQWAVPPTPMAASGNELPASVPAPQSLWAGLGMLAAMGGWKHLAGRRMAAQ